MRDRRTAATFAFAAIVALLLGPLAVAQTSSGVDESEYLKAAEAIRCDCGCHPQSVQDCACGRGAEMRGEVRALVAKGMSGDDVIAQYVAEKGEQILLAPAATGFNLVAWIGPILGLFLASGSMLFLLRRWKNTHPAAEALPATAGAAPDPAYDERLRKALERLD